MLSIERGLPEVAQDEEDDLDYEYKLAQNQDWTCKTCQVKNPANKETCWCGTKKPTYKIAAPKPPPKKQEQKVATKKKSKGFFGR